MQIQGQLTVIKEIQGGGLGKLFKCRDEHGQLFVAKFPKDALFESQRLIDDEARRFQRHQGEYVVKYIGPVSHTDGRRGFAMELMDGDLVNLVRQNGHLSPATVVRYMRPVVRGLAEVHASASGAFHGDIKMANILHKGDIAKLADFGLARGGFGQTIMMGPHTGGTPGYMPPELLSSPQGDVYSLGAVFVALLRGREPQQGELLNISIPGYARLEALINRMLARTARLRPTVAMIQRELDELQPEVKPLVASNSGWKALVAFAATVAGVVLVGKLIADSD